MSERLRKTLRITGMVLIAASLCAIGYAAYNLISTEILTSQGLDDVDQMLQEFEAFTGHPETLAADPAGGGDSLQTGDAANDPTAGETAGDGSPAPTGTATAAPGAGPTKKPAFMGKLVFPSLGRSVAVSEGATKEDLARGAAHHPRSSPAGAVGNCVIFGHRNTVFRGFDKLKDGDTIKLEVPGATYSYRVTSMAVVEPNDPRIFKAYSEKVMTLVTCYPFHYVGSAPQRYIVVCVLD